MVNEQMRSVRQRPARVGKASTSRAFSAALGVAAAAASALTVAFPSVLTGVPGANGNMLGTALVVLVVGVPAVTIAATAAAHGSSRAVVIWLGTLGYLLYQAVMFCFATPLNHLFLLYVAYLGLSVWSIVSLLRSVDLSALADRPSSKARARTIAVYGLAVVALNAKAWLSEILPAIFRESESVPG